MRSMEWAGTAPAAGQGGSPGESAPGEARRLFLVDETAPFFTIGQVAELLGVAPATLRRFEEQELVLPSRSRGGQRRYSPKDVELLRDVMALVEEGVTPAGARKVLDLRRQVAQLQDELADLRLRAD